MNAISVPTLSDIARCAGLDPATVSRALNNHPRVAARTRLRVQVLARDMGYVSNRDARRKLGSRNGHLRQIAFVHVVSPALRNLLPGDMSILRGVESAVSRLGGGVRFIQSTAAETRAKIVDPARNDEVDGYLLLGHVDDAIARGVSSTGRPFVILGSHSCSRPVNCVDVDFRGATNMAVRHLASMGHTRIAYLGSRHEMAYQHAMLAGYHTAVEALKLETSAELVRTGDDSHHLLTPEWFQQLLETRPPATAIIASEGGELILNALRQLEIPVPDELSVMAIGIDAPADEDIASVILSVEELGSAGVSVLNEMAGGSARSPRTVSIGGRVVPGRSCREQSAQSAPRSDRRQCAIAEASDEQGANQ